MRYSGECYDFYFCCNTSGCSSTTRIISTASTDGVLWYGPGAAPDAPYTTTTRRLDAGDKLVLYTDGVIDAGSPAFEPFGDKRFRAALVALAETPAARLAEGLLAEVDAYLGGRPFADDLTLVVAEALPPEGAEA